MRVLLVGFGPFPGAPFNPSGAVVKALARRRRPALAGIDLSAHVLATGYAAADRDLPRWLLEKPDIVLMFGLAGRRRELCIETRARNAVSVLFPDASGHRPQRGTIDPKKPPSLKGRAPFARLLGAVCTSAVPARLSRDAGRYLCNYAYWQALAHAPGALVQFVHIPPVAVSPRRRLPRNRRQPSLRQMVGAAERLLIALLAAKRH